MQKVYTTKTFTTSSWEKIFSILRAFEKAVELVGDCNLSNILIVADDENTLEHEMFQVKSNAPEC